MSATAHFTALGAARIARAYPASRIQVCKHSSREQFIRVEAARMGDKVGDGHWAIAEPPPLE